MNYLENYSTDLLFMGSTFYLALAVSTAKLGSERKCGSVKIFLYSIFFTPLIGMAIALSSSRKNVLKTVHYRCPNCGLEHTTKYDCCPTCSKEGKHKRLIKICMQTY